MTEIISRKEAEAKGLTKYFTGKSCPREHVSERFVKDRSCCACRAEKNHLPQNRAARKRYAEKHPEKMREYGRTYEQRNREERISRNRTPEGRVKQKEYSAAWKERDPDAYLERHRRYRRNHLEKVKAKERRYVKANPARYAAHAAKRRAMILQRTPPWLTEEQHTEIQVFYDEAARLTEETGIIYSVDHVVPLQGPNVSGLHVPWNLGILTKSDNSSKHNKFED